MLELLQRWHLKMAYLRECGAAVHDDLSSPNTGWHQLKDDQKSMLSLYNNFKCDQITVDEQSNIIISNDLFFPLDAYTFQSAQPPKLMAEGDLS